MTKRRFHFKLESLRTLREHAELNVMKELAGELGHAASLRRELSAVEERLNDARAPIVEASTASELLVRQTYVERMESELHAARHRTAAQDGHVEQTRLRLAEAARARQTLDLLEERRRAVHTLETRRLERNDNDEISLINHMNSGSAA
jgi:flagellar export protein FliJ